MKWKYLFPLPLCIHPFLPFLPFLSLLAIFPPFFLFPLVPFHLNFFFLPFFFSYHPNSLPSYDVLVLVQNTHTVTKDVYRAAVPKLNCTYINNDKQWPYHKLTFLYKTKIHKLPIYLFVCLTVYLLICFPVCLSAYTYVSFFVHAAISIFLSRMQQCTCRLFSGR